MSQRIPLAWRQLTFEKMKLVTAISGVMVAVLLMWIQLGILEALYASTTVPHRHIQADLVVFHPLSENLNKLKPFSTRTLYRCRSHPDVLAVGELLVGIVDWRNPESGEQRQIMAYAFDPDEAWFNLPGVKEHANDLRRADTFLFDRKSKHVFGPVEPWLEQAKDFEIEVNLRRCKPVGLTSIASSFGQEGSIVTNRENFLRLNPNFVPGEVHLGFVRLKPGADVKHVQERFRQELSPEAVVMTPEEFTEFELRYWKTNAPVGFIFTMGTVVGFFIGFIVVYQILYTDVSNHLPQFATMKAMGFTDNYLLKLVLGQGLLLAIVGYIPGSILAMGVYHMIQKSTAIEVAPTWECTGLLLALTCLMCLMSGAMATRRLRSADPADVF